MTRKSLQYELLEMLCLEKYPNNNTRTAYKKDIKAFAEYAKGQGYKNVKALGDGLEVLQSYSNYLQEKGFSPSTIHRKLCSPCRALEINMKEICKPKRTSDRITRGRRKDANKQGKEEIGKPEFSRLVSLQSVTGIRRAELRKLTGENIARDSSGYLNVIVKRGKGGKEQYQRILPENERTVLEIFQGIGEKERVFSPDEMKNHINLHGIRAEVARKAYNYYSDRLKHDLQYRDKLLEELRDRYRLLHPEPEKTIRAFLTECLNDKPYTLRGHNKARALATGKPVNYDRLALMAVSVFHLSHWRLDVTVTNYLV